MKKLIGMVLVSLALFASCVNTGNHVAAVFEPVIGTWSATVLGAPTTLIFNANKSCVETTTVLGLGKTKSGNWIDDGKTITRTWSDKSVDVLYYTFNTDVSEMTLSSAPNGLSTTYTRSN